MTNTSTCYCCGYVFLDSDTKNSVLSDVDNERVMVCDQCHINYVSVCSDCGIEYLGGIPEDFDRFLCHQCLENEYSRCESCSHLCYTDDMYCLRSGTRQYGYVCGECFDAYYIMCDSCREIVPCDESYGIDGENGSYCYECYSNIQRENESDNYNSLRSYRLDHDSLKVDKKHIKHMCKKCENIIDNNNIRWAPRAYRIPHSTDYRINEISNDVGELHKYIRLYGLIDNANMQFGISRANYDILHQYLTENPSVAESFIIAFNKENETKVDQLQIVIRDESNYYNTIGISRAIRKHAYPELISMLKTLFGYKEAEESGEKDLML